VSYKIRFFKELCSGCKVCERFCSIVHNGSTPKIRIVESGEDFEAMVCVQCDERRCVKACGDGAIFIDEYSGAPIISADICSRCMKCVLACEYGGLHYDSLRGDVLACDTCGQSFLCVTLCTRGALSKIIDFKHVVLKKAFKTSYFLKEDYGSDKRAG